MIFSQARAFNCRSFSQQGDRCYLRWFFSFTLANIVQDHNVCEKRSIHFHRSVTDFCGKSLFPSQRRRLGHSSRFHATRGAGGWSLRKYLIASQNRSTCCEKSSCLKTIKPTKKIRWCRGQATRRRCAQGQPATGGCSPMRRQPDTSFEPLGYSLSLP